MRRELNIVSTFVVVYMYACRCVHVCFCMFAVVCMYLYSSYIYDRGCKL